MRPVLVIAAIKPGGCLFRHSYASVDGGLADPDGGGHLSAGQSREHLRVGEERALHGYELRVIGLPDCRA